MIPNPIDPAPALPVAARPMTVTAVGRLVPQKGFDLLLAAFAQASRDQPDWRLVIWGEGGERAALLAQAERLGIAGTVRLPGLTSLPHQWLDEAGIFVLSSRFEGFPNVLGEAMAAGLPAIAFDCPWGPAEMIEDGVNGLLVPAEHVDALGEALARLMAAPALRARLGHAAAGSVGRFGLRPVLAQWQHLLLAALAAAEGGAAARLHSNGVCSTVPPNIRRPIA